MINLKQIVKMPMNAAYENLWAQTWRDTMRGIDWINDLPSISPGRWAVGYNYLYVMTRILNEIEPHKVLDVGLGVSTTLFSTYFRNHIFEDGMHMVIEHDASWIDFYLNKHKSSDYTTIRKQDLVRKSINVRGGGSYILGI